MLGYDWPRLHAALNDLPVALLLVAVLFELLALATRKESFRQVSYWTLLIGAIGGVAAVLSGLQAAKDIAHGDAVHRVMRTHQLLGYVTLGLFGALTLWRLLREQRMGTTERAVALAIALGAAGVLIATGVFGGRLVFDHAAGIPTPVLTAEVGERAKGHEHASGEGHIDADHSHEPAAGVTLDSAAGAGDSATRGGSDHVDPPGTPPHTHAPAKSGGHPHPPGTPAHDH